MFPRRNHTNQATQIRQVKVTRNECPDIERLYSVIGGSWNEESLYQIIQLGSQVDFLDAPSIMVAPQRHSSLSGNILDMESSMKEDLPKLEFDKLMIDARNLNVARGQMTQLKNYDASSIPHMACGVDGRN